VKAAYKDALTAGDEALAQKANAYWVSFVSTGNPSPTGLPPWPRYDSKTDVLMNFTDEGPVAMADPWKARLDLTESLVGRKPTSVPSPSTGVGAITSGVWTISGDIQGYPLHETCSLTVQNKVLSGSCKGEGKAYDVTGTTDGGYVTFKHGGEYNGSPLTMTYSGTVSDQGLLRGSVDVDPMNASGNFTAKKTEPQ
jgi:hypothetical protein